MTDHAKMPADLPTLRAEVEAHARQVVGLMVCTHELDAVCEVCAEQLDAYAAAVRKLAIAECVEKVRAIPPQPLTFDARLRRGFAHGVRAALDALTTEEK